MGNSGGIDSGIEIDNGFDGADELCTCEGVSEGGGASLVGALAGALVGAELSDEEAEATALVGGVGSTALDTTDAMLDTPEPMSDVKLEAAWPRSDVI